MASRKSSSTGPSDDQIKAAETLKGLMQQMANLGSVLEKSFETQATAMQQMATAMAAISGDSSANQMTAVNDAIKTVIQAFINLQQTSTEALGATSAQSTAAAEALAKLSDSMKQVDKSNPKNLTKLAGEAKKAQHPIAELKEKLGKLVEELSVKFPKAAAAAAGGLEGFAKGWKATMALLKGAYGVITTLVDSIWEIGKSIIAIPFEIFGKLVEEADKAGGQVSELAQALNELRKEFGSLSGPTNTAIQATAKGMDKLKLPGINATAAFGNLAEKTKYMMELFVAGGPAMRNFGKEIEKDNGAIAVFAKGLGVSNENLGTFMTLAQARGEKYSDFFVDVTKQSQKLAKQFGLDAKVMSKDITKAAADVRHFGDVSTKEIAAATAFANKLGISLDKITGSLDTFDTFDSAAENVSKLNEAMNTNIDVGKIMNAKDSAEQLEIIRAEFAKAGVQGEKMNRYQRKLVQNLTSYDDATQMAAFSTKNQNVKLKDMQKGAEAASKSTMTLEQSVASLAKEMDLVLKSGATGLTEGKGLMGAFVHGISDGLQMSKEFQQMMMAVKGVINTVYMEGKKFGQMLLETFPGLKDIFKDITALFSSKKFGELLQGIRKDVEVFIKDLTGPNAFGNLMEKIKNRFFNFFNKEESAGQRLIKDGSKFFSAIVDIFTGAVNWILDSVSDFWGQMSSGFSNPGPLLSKVITTLNKIAKIVGDFITATLTPMFGRIFDGLADSLTGGGAEKAAKGTGKAMDKIFEPIAKAMDGLWERIKPALKKLWGWLKAEFKKGLSELITSPEMWKAIGILMIPSIISGLGGAMFQAGSTAASQKLLKGIAEASQQTTASVDALRSSMTGATSAANNVAAAAGNAGRNLTTLESGLGAAAGTGGKATGMLSNLKGALSGAKIGLTEIVVAYETFQTTFKATTELLEKAHSAKENEGGIEAQRSAANFEKKMSDMEKMSAAEKKAALEAQKNTLLAQQSADNLKNTALEGGLAVFTLGAGNYLKYVTGLGEKSTAELETRKAQLEAIDKELEKMSGSKVKDEIIKRAEASASALKEAQKKMEEAENSYNPFSSVAAARAAYDDAKNIDNLAQADVEALKNAGKKKAEAIKSTATIESEALEAAGKKAAEEHEQYMKELGPTTLDNALERFKKVDELAKKVMGQNFDIDKKMAAIRDKIGSIDFTLFSDPSKKTALEGAIVDLNKIKELAGGIADVGILIKTAGDRFAGATSALNEKSTLRSALGEGGSLGKLFKGASAAMQGVSADELLKATTVVATAKDFFNNLNTIVNGIGSLTKLSQMKVDTSGLGKIKETIREITRAFSASGPDAVDAKAMDSVGTNIDGISVMLRTLDNSITILINFQRNIIKSSTEISSNSKLLSDTAGKIAKEAGGSGTYLKLFEALKNVFPAPHDPSLGNVLNDLGAAATWAKGEVDKSVVPAVKAYNEIVSVAQQLETALGTSAKLDIKAKLGTFTSQFGKNLGAAGAYTVTAKKDVVINVAFKIAMDTHELEKTLVTTNGSIIKQRLNLLLDAVKNTESAQKLEADIDGAKIGAGEPLNMTNHG